MYKFIDFFTICMKENSVISIITKNNNETVGKVRWVGETKICLAVNSDKGKIYGYEEIEQIVRYKCEKVFRTKEELS